MFVYTHDIHTHLCRLYPNIPLYNLDFKDYRSRGVDAQRPSNTSLIVNIRIYDPVAPPRDPPNMLGPRNTPLPCILRVFGGCWHIYPCNAHTKVKLPTCDLFLHIRYNPLYTPDKPSCYIFCLHTTYIRSTCYRFTIYALST